MKKVVFSLISILMLVAMIISISMMSVSAEGNANLLSNAATVDYYGRDALSKLPSSADLLYAYDAICVGVEGSADKIKVYDTAPSLTVEQISTVMDAYRRDHAEHFWLGTQYSYLKDASTNYVHSVAPSYIMEGDELTQARARFEEEIFTIKRNSQIVMFLFASLALFGIAGIAINPFLGISLIAFGVIVCIIMAEYRSWQYLRFYDKHMRRLFKLYPEEAEYDPLPAGIKPYYAFEYLSKVREQRRRRSISRAAERANEKRALEEAKKKEEEKVNQNTNQ